MLILTMLETSTNAGLQRDMCLHYPSTGQLALCSIVYRRIVYYGGRVYGHDESYKGGNLVSRVARRLENWSGSIKYQL